MVASKKKRDTSMIEEESLIEESVVRKALFEAVEGTKESASPLVDLFFRAEPIDDDIQLSAKDQRQVLLNHIGMFNKGQIRRFFAGLATVLSKIVETEAFIPESAYESDNEEEENDDDPLAELADVRSTEALDFLKAAAMCTESHLNTLLERRNPQDAPGKIYNVVDEVFTVAEHLHNVLFTLQSCGDDGLQVQSIIMSLCESWWDNSFVDQECLVVQLVPLLVAKSLDESAQKSDVKRLFQMRDALEVLDWEDESSRDTRDLLLRTVSIPLFLRMPEGKRFVAGLFHLHESLVADLHQAIRVQIPDAKKTILQAYGEIYFRAWKDSEEQPEFRKAIEETALQDLMYAVLHVGTPAMANNLQMILSSFYDAKKTPQVERLLNRMYGPILWRSLSAANPCVRVNAVVVLADTFPLQEGIAQSDKAIKKGVLALKNLLKDNDPRVRVAGSEATAQILSTFWDVLPTGDIRALLNHVVAEHASDASSSAVRAGALNSVCVLLDTEQSHAVLRALLPSLGNLIHDKVERVRLATVRLLLKVKGTPGIKYYHVVPVDHLLARLADEGCPPKNPTNPVASALTSLMMNSYFPQGSNATGADQVKRTLNFLSSDPIAANVFYSNLATHLSVNSVSKLAALLLRCLVAAVETDKARMPKAKKGNRKRRHYGTQQEEPAEDDGSLSASDTALMASLAETICCLWESVESELMEPENEPCHNFLLDAFSGAVLSNVNAHFEEKAANCDDSVRKEAKIMDDCHRTCAAILRCAGRLPPKSVEGLSTQITMKLSSIDSEDAAHENITPHVALLCLWGLTQDVTTSLSLSILKAFDDEEDNVSPSFEASSSLSKKRKSGRAKTSSDSIVPTLPPRVALEVLEEILRGPDPSSVAAREAILSSSATCSALEQSLERGTVFAEHLLRADPIFGQSMAEDNVELILRACELYGRFALHKEASQNKKLGFSTQAKTLLDWTTNCVVPAFHGTANSDGTPLRDLNISRISASSGITPESPTPMPPPKQRVNRSKTPERFDTSFGSAVSGEIDIDTSFAADTSGFARGAAISLMQSSCVIFSEWLAVGGSGSDEIAAAAVKWCDIFDTEVDQDAVQAQLLPAFLRLTIQLCTSTGQFEMLEAIIQKCKENANSDEAAVVKKSISSLLNARDCNGETSTNGTVLAILSAADKLLENGTSVNEEINEQPESVADVWENIGGYVATVLSSVVANKQAAFGLARELVSRLKSRSHDSETTRMALFETRCLWFMCNNTTKDSALDVRKLVRKVDAESFDEEGDLREVVENMLESAA